jgi:hypothetical protein
VVLEAQAATSSTPKLTSKNKEWARTHESLWELTWPSAGLSGVPVILATICQNNKGHRALKCSQTHDPTQHIYNVTSNRG